jgi:hypothetical protein
MKRSDSVNQERNKIIKSDDEEGVNENSTPKKKNKPKNKSSNKKQKTECEDNENNQPSDDDEAAKKQRFNDEECTEKMKEKFANKQLGKAVNEYDNLRTMVLRSK